MSLCKSTTLPGNQYSVVREKSLHRLSSSYSPVSVTNLVRLTILSSLLISTLSFTFLTTYAATAPVRAKLGVTSTTLVRNGLVGHWTFDGKNMTNATATDSSGQGNNGTLTNMVATSSVVQGKIGQALRLNGVSNSVVLRDSSVFDVGGAGSWCVWSYSKANQTAMPIFMHDVSSGVSGTSYKWIASYLTTNSSLLAAYVRIAGVAYSVTGPAQSSGYYNNAWHHVCTTFDKSLPSSRLKIYINGILAGQSDAANGNIDSGDFPEIGRWRTGGSSYFNGYIDDVRIYNRTLSSTEVQSIYKAGGGVVTSVPTVVNKVGTGSGLVGHWTFDGKNMTNTTARDISGNANTGTLTNMVATSSVTQGKIGQGLKFDGTNDFVNINSSASLQSSVFTYTAWVKPIGTAGGNHRTIIGGSANNSDPQFRMDSSNNLKLLKQDIAVIGTSVGTIPNDQWSHIAISYDSSGNYIFYINGTASGSGTSLQTFTFSNFYIGHRGGTMAEIWAGLLDDVRVYNRVLSAKEIQSLYKAGGGAVVKPVTSFTCGTSNVTDADGNVYNTVSVGSQCWMKQSLRTGTRINLATAQSNNGIIEKYCFDDTASNCTSNNPNQPDGGLYQWNEAMQYVTTAGARGICPSGWHIPTHDQLTTMERAICTSGSCATDFPYDTSTTGFRGTNEGTKLRPNGTSALEVNLAGYVEGGYFDYREVYGLLWSSSESVNTFFSWFRNVISGSAQVNRGGGDKSSAYSVRCLKD